MDKSVRQFFAAAANWSAGGDTPPRDLIGAVAALEPPRIEHPAEARDELWRILSYPERGRALAVLNAVDLLVELFPSWVTEIEEQDRALRAVEEVHLERWAEGLSESAFQRLCAHHDARVDNRLNGWALTALATLLCRQDGDAAVFISELQLDLAALEVTEGEQARLTGIVTEFPTVYARIAAGEHDRYKVIPGSIIAALAHLLAESQNQEQISGAIAAADRWLRQL